MSTPATEDSSKDQQSKDVSPNKDKDEHGTMRVVRSGSTSQESNKLLVSGENYFSIHFSGCGFMLPYHFGVVAALKDFNVTFSKATASSGGVMAALALLGGADLKLGIRQCFDLRDEKATTPGSIRSFFAVYREYFRCFRSFSFQRDMRLSALRGKLFVRLGRWTSSGWEIFQVTDFDSEQDLEDAFMSAAYVPFGTSVLPPYFRGTVAYDAALIDFLSGQIGFAANKASLWPPEPEDDDPAKAQLDRTKVLVVPTQGLGHLINPSDLVVVNGKFRSLLDFWAHPSVMQRGFVEGYQMAASLIDTSKTGLPPRVAEFKKKREEAVREGTGKDETLTVEEQLSQDSGAAALSLFEEVMQEQKSWKTTESFVKPPLWFERDPLFALFIFVALVVFLLSYLLQRSLNAALVNSQSTHVL